MNVKLTGHQTHMVGLPHTDLFFTTDTDEEIVVSFTMFYNNDIQPLLEDNVLNEIKTLVENTTINIEDEDELYLYLFNDIITKTIKNKDENVHVLRFVNENNNYEREDIE